MALLLVSCRNCPSQSIADEGRNVPAVFRGLAQGGWPLAGRAGVKLVPSVHNGFGKADEQAFG